jgi:ACS family hexuronate transporter-like MFS transporter
VADMPVWLLVVAVLLLGFFGYPITPLILSLSSQVVPRGVAGSAIGFVMNVGMLAGAITPAVAGFLQEHMQMSTVWLLAALVQLISCAALLFTGRLQTASEIEAGRTAAEASLS